MSKEQREWYEEVTIKTLLVAAALVFAAQTISVAQVPDAISVGRQAETLGIVGILAALIVVLVVALVTVYRGKEEAALRREERLEKLIDQVATVVASDTEASHATAALLVDVRNTLAKCHAVNMKG